MINYPEYSVAESEIEKLKVIWTSEGVEILFSTGHKLFVPKERFTGGR
ncbi:MAG: hypothetical protein N2510_10300 [Ignavibacteria bacterium]|nr:hypothetical protein [Ignavibacteria bacterium]